MPITADEYKSLMRCWATGVTVITTQSAEGPHGMTANSFTGVSLDPPLVLVCVSRTTRTHQLLQQHEAFGVHILQTGQEELSIRCAGLRGEAGNQLADLPHQISPLGVPLLDHCLAALECRVQAAYDGGDHIIYVGEILSASIRHGTPLLYYSRDYHEIK